MIPRGRNGLNLVIAAVLGASGLILAAQGLGVPIGGGFMIGDIRWTGVGIVVIGIAVVIAWRELRRPA